MTQEALKLALEALEVATTPLAKDRQKVLRAITAIKEALAQTELCKYGQELKSCTSNPMDCQCAIDASLAQTQEPVVVWELFEDGWNSVADQEWMEKLPVGTKLYTLPPQRTWVGLTDEEVRKICVNEWGGYEQCRAIEAKLKEKNT